MYEANLILSVVENLIATSSTAVNILVLYFIIFKTPTELNDYRFFLFLITASCDDGVARERSLTKFILTVRAMLIAPQ